MGLAMANIAQPHQFVTQIETLPESYQGTWGLGLGRGLGSELSGFRTASAAPVVRDR